MKIYIASDHRGVDTVDREVRISRLLCTVIGEVIRRNCIRTVRLKIESVIISVIQGKQRFIGCRVNGAGRRNREAVYVGTLYTDLVYLGIPLCNKGHITNLLVDSDDLVTALIVWFGFLEYFLFFLTF